MVALGPDLLKPRNDEDAHTLDQVPNFLPQLDAIIGSVSMIPVELTVFGIVSFFWV